MKQLNRQSRDAVTSVYDLVQLLTHTCVTLFDQQDTPGGKFQFFDMFEQSIAHVVCFPVYHDPAVALTCVVLLPILKSMRSLY